ncbi:MAG: hypothetical protein SFY66_21075 [Oculatellaceae cyanobacterium bins.114]|nr:hypothetical protein [Oculatellaceae cyanobacterium bins.114]
MATATVLEFMHKTAEDEALRHQLEALLGVGDGNISSEAELDTAESEALTERAPMVAEFAAQNGFEFSGDELIVVIDAFQKHQTGQLSDSDFAQLIGISTADPSSGEAIANAASPLTRLAQYMSKTYLGIDLVKK